MSARVCVCLCLGVCACVCVRARTHQHRYSYTVTQTEWDAQLREIVVCALNSTSLNKLPFLFLFESIQWTTICIDDNLSFLMAFTAKVHCFHACLSSTWNCKEFLAEFVGDVTAKNIEWFENFIRLSTIVPLSTRSICSIRYPSRGLDSFRWFRNFTQQWFEIKDEDSKSPTGDQGGISNGKTRPNIHTDFLQVSEYLRRWN